MLASNKAGACAGAGGVSGSCEVVSSLLTLARMVVDTYPLMSRTGNSAELIEFARLLISNYGAENPASKTSSAKPP